MSRVNGQLVTCDRCGTQTFIKHIGDGETSDGFTRWNKFESLPNGWGYYKNKNLCPDCFKEWNRLETEFMNKETKFFKEVLNND